MGKCYTTPPHVLYAQNILPVLKAQKKIIELLIQDKTISLESLLKSIDIAIKSYEAIITKEFKDLK